MDILLIHLSDIHIRESSDLQKEVGAIREALNEHKNHVDKIFLIISGDVGFSGRRTEYENATRFVKTIHDYVKDTSSATIENVFVPGNHDCNFDASTLAREATVKELSQFTRLSRVDDECCEVCTRPQKDFFEFRDEHHSKSALVFASSLLNIYDFDLGDQRLFFYCYNSAWVSQLSEKPGSLVFPFQRFTSESVDDSCIRISLLHHPMNWFYPGHYRDFREHLSNNSDLILTGHEHEFRGSITEEHSGTTVLTVEGCVLAGSEGKDGYGFNFLILRVPDRTYRLESFKISGDTLIKKEVDKEWRGFRDIPKKPEGDFAFTTEFLNRISDPGASFKHPRKVQVRIEDVFVFQTLQRIDKTRERLDRCSAETLLGLPAGRQVILKGEEKSGKTTLLFELTKAFRKQGLAPIYVSAADFSRASQEEIKKVVEHAANQIYGEKGKEKFFQLEKEQRVILVDDFQKIRVSTKYRSNILKWISKEFSRIIISVDNLYRVAELLKEGDGQLFVDYEEYEVLPFGHRLRHALISKWNRIAIDETCPEQTLATEDDRATKIVNTIIGRNYVPSLPIFIITMLQSIDTGHSSDLQHSAYGHYYYYLIVQNLKTINIKNEQLDEFYNYITELAFFFFRKSRRELSVVDLSEFRQYFLEVYGLDIELNERLRTLEHANIVLRRGDHYSFKYSYIYFFFVAQYLANHIGEEEARDKVRFLCKHLYYSPFANIFVFLTHHSKEPFIIEEVLSVAKSLMRNTAPVDFGKETAMVNQLVDQMPKAVLKQIDVQKNRAEHLEEQDEHDQSGLEEESEKPVLKEKGIEELDLMDQVLLGFRAVEILGQLLKNYYGSLRLPTKMMMLNESYSLPLRALHEFFNTLNENVDVLVDDVKKLLAKKKADLPQNEREKLARRAIFELAGLVSYGFIKRVSTATGSEHLKDLYGRVLKDAQSDAYFLVDISTKLDFPGNIPFDELTELEDKFKGNFFARRLLQSFALEHLYMYETTESDKQKLSSILNIDIRIQRAIDTVSKDTKLLTEKK